MNGRSPTIQRLEMNTPAIGLKATKVRFSSAYWLLSNSFRSELASTCPPSKTAPFQNWATPVKEIKKQRVSVEKAVFIQGSGE
jgi:hypothetical protein